MGLLERLSSRRSEPEPAAPIVGAVASGDALYSTRALRRFMSALTARESPVLLDLGPVVGGNVSFFGEQLGCKIFVEDIFADLDRHIRTNALDAFPEFLKRRLPQTDDGVDGILCWDLLDYLDRPAAQALATELCRVLRPAGALLVFFATSPSRYTKYVIADELNLWHRPYRAARGRQAMIQHRDIMRLFGGLTVSDSFLLKNNLREILFRKPA
jgi:hypothetical protein